MPSPKAVLRDIHDLKLDPKVAHVGHDLKGRLHSDKTKFIAVHHVVKHVAEPAPVVEPVDFPEVKPGIHTAPEPAKEEIKVVEEQATVVKTDPPVEPTAPVVEEVKPPEEKVEAKVEEKPEPELESKVSETKKSKKADKKEDKKTEEPKAS